MKKIILTIGGVLALMLGGITASTASASAAAPIDGLRIGQIGYNAVGNDRPWNRNQEYVDVTASTAKDITGLVVQDSWRKATDAATSPACNTFTVTADKVDADLKTGDGKVVLPAGHTLRVYVGKGTPAAFGPGGRYHAVYMDHGVGASAGCGYHGHFLNNTHDTVWIKLGDREERKPYDFRRGYYVG